jgi:hypothetical protein
VENDKTIEIEFLEEGDEIEFDPQVTILQGMDDLLSKLDTIIQNNVELARADLARNQTQLEVLAQLQALTRKSIAQGSPKVDLEPLKTVLTEIQEQQNRPRPTWEFEVNRDNRGFMTKITAKPQGQSIH